MNFSIIIPTLNEEKLLPGILKQLYDKSLKDKFKYEIIVSDGGSTDETIEHALKYADKVKTNSGNNTQNIASGRNEGARIAEGNIFIFINADIRLDNVENLLNFISNKFIDTKYLALTTWVRIFPEEEKITDRIFHFCFNNFFALLNNSGIGMGRGECQAVKKDVFELVNGYNEDLAAGEDFNLFVRIRKLGKILYTKDICVYESPRRFRKLGYVNITFTWIMNGFSVLFKNKAISREWRQVR